MGMRGNIILERVNAGCRCDISPALGLPTVGTPHTQRCSAATRQGRDYSGSPVCPAHGLPTGAPRATRQGRDYSGSPGSHGPCLAPPRRSSLGLPRANAGPAVPGKSQSSNITDQRKE